jgi:SNF2 family DNA or RNA helicase
MQVRSYKITRHFKEGSLTFTTYHGPTRQKQLKQIESYDVVLTTYETLKADCPKVVRGKRKAVNDERSGGLHEFRWHRVVLDEGQLSFFPFWLAAFCLCYSSP